MLRKARLVLLALLVVGTSLTSAAFTCFDQSDFPDEFKNCGGDRYGGAKPFSTRSNILGRNGVVATQQPLGAEVGLDILKAGGNALDAAIGVNAMMSLLEPGMNGVGGDLFALIWDPKTERLYGMNGSGRSSRSVSFEDMEALLEGDRFIPNIGPLSHSIPGTVSAWFEMHRRFGTVPMAELLRPVIEYAEDGVPVHAVAASDLNDALNKFQNPNNIDIITRQGRNPNNLEGFYDIFVKENGETPREGEVFRNPTLAAMYRSIANERGDDVFYRGEVAEQLAAFYAEAGIPLDLTDLNTHTSTWVDPISTNYRGWDVWEIPPNGQGLAALQQLNILEGYNLTEMGHLSADYLHVHIAAKQLAYADRAKFYADPDFNDLDYSYLLSKEYAAERRQLIDMENAFVRLDGGNPFPEQYKRLSKGDTILVTVGDRSGMMVSLIQSNFANMGSGLVVPSLGFALQNRGALFAMDRSHYNSFAPNKRPFHTIIPAFVTQNGRPKMAFGLKGGTMQAMGHAQIITNMVDFGLNPQDAGDAARYFHDGSNEVTGYVMEDGGHVGFESGVSGEVREELRRRGHNVDDFGPYVGAHQAVYWDEVNGVYWGASEMRYDGHAVAY